jgi:hypothetical protein
MLLLIKIFELSQLMQIKLEVLWVLTNLLAVGTMYQKDCIHELCPFTQFVRSLGIPEFKPIVGFMSGYLSNLVYSAKKFKKDVVGILLD